MYFSRDFNDFRGGFSGCLSSSSRLSYSLDYGWRLGAMEVREGEFACAGVVGVDHLLIHYKEAYQLWCLVFRSFGISWVLLECERSFIWLEELDGKTLVEYLEFGFVCLMWIIWWEKNKHIVCLRIWRVQGTSFQLILLALCLTSLVLWGSWIEIPFQCLLSLYLFVHNCLYFL